MVGQNDGITKFSKLTELRKGTLLDRINRMNRIFGKELQIIVIFEARSG
jgi:hypothetical protein